MNLDPYLIHHIQKVTKKWIKDLNIKVNTIKLFIILDSAMVLLRYDNKSTGNKRKINWT